MEWNEVNEFHQRFPRLLKSWEGEDEDEEGPQGSHCWGGILVMRLEGITNPRLATLAQRFPAVSTIGRALQQANPSLRKKTAFRYARCVIKENDAKKYAKAGQILKSALDFGHSCSALTSTLIDRQLAEILAHSGNRDFVLMM